MDNVMEVVVITTNYYMAAADVYAERQELPFYSSRKGGMTIMTEEEFNKRHPDVDLPETGEYVKIDEIYYD